MKLDKNLLKELVVETLNEVRRGKSEDRRGIHLPPDRQQPLEEEAIDEEEEALEESEETVEESEETVEESDENTMQEMVRRIVRELTNG